MFDVGPFLEGVSNLQGKLEDAIAKSRLLLEAIEGSQSKYVEKNEDYPVLRSLKGRLAASQVPNESLATELVKFKIGSGIFCGRNISKSGKRKKNKEGFHTTSERTGLKS